MKRVVSSAHYRHVHGLLLAIVLSLPQPSTGQTTETSAEAQQVLASVQQTYDSLMAWHFEHQIIVEEVPAGGAPARLADLILISASKPAAGAKGPLNETMCSDKCAIDTRTPQRRFMLGGNGNSAWTYFPDSNEYTTGPTLRSVSSSVAGPMALGVHVFPLLALDPRQWISPRLAGSESLQVNGETRSCWVIEATLKATGLSVPQPGAGPPDPDPAMLASTTFFVSALGFQGLLSTPQVLFTGAPANAEPPRLRVWVDKERFLVLKRTVAESTQRVSAGAASLSDTVPVELRLSDTFTVAKTGNSVADILFEFQPPPGSRARAR
jgi:hypothetical protein